LKKLTEKRKNMLKVLERLGIKPRWITCDYCPNKTTCNYAYDPYNTDGDCLLEK